MKELRLESSYIWNGEEDLELHELLEDLKNNNGGGAGFG